MKWLFPICMFVAFWVGMFTLAIWYSQQEYDCNLQGCFQKPDYGNAKRYPYNP